MSRDIRRSWNRVTVDGREVQALAVSCSFGADLRTATASVTVGHYPEWARAWSELDIWMGADESTAQVSATGLRFRGYIPVEDRDLWARTSTLTGRGRLVKAEAHAQSDGGVSFANSGLGTPDEEIVESVLLTCGITAMSIHGTGVPIGSIATDQVVWLDGESALDFIDRFDETCLGYRTFDLPGGLVARRLITGRPTIGAVAIFTEGEDIEVARRNWTVLDVYNRIVAIGYDNGSGPVVAVSQQPSEILPPGSPPYSTYEFSSPLIERSAPTDPGDGLAAQDVAEWILLEKHQQRIELTFTTPRDDHILPGSTITVRRSQTSQLPGRIGETRNYWVQHVTLSINEQGEFSQVLKVRGGIGSAAAIERPPIVDFSLRVEIETVLIAGNVTTLYLCYCEAAAYGQSGSIIRHDWTASGTGVNPSSGEGLFFNVAFTDLASASITLEVEDSGGNVGDVTKFPADVASDQRLRRRLYVAADPVGEAYTGHNWNNHRPGGGVLVSEVAQGPFWATTSPDVLVSYDDLQTAPTAYQPFTDPASNISAINGETDRTDQSIVAGSNDGRMAVSLNGGASWTVRDTPSVNIDPPQPLRSVHANGNHWHAMTDSWLFESHDGGLDWRAVAVTHDGEVFRQYSPGRNRNLIICEGGRLVFDPYSGVVHTFDGAAPGDIAAITPAIRSDTFYIVDGNGQFWQHATDGGTVFEPRESLPAGTPQLRSIRRDGDIVDLLYAAAGTGGLWKTIDAARTTTGWYLLRSPGAGNSPADAVYRRVGVHGNLSGELFVAGTVYVWGQSGLMVRGDPNDWQVAFPSAPFDQVRHFHSPYGAPSRMWVFGRVKGATGTPTTWYTSIDGGATWNEVTWPAGIAHGDIQRLAVVDNQPNVAYVAVTGSGITNAINGIYKTSDGGLNWSVVYQAGSSPHRQALWVSVFGNRRFAGQAQDGSGNPYLRYTDDDFGSVTNLSGSHVSSVTGTPQLLASPDNATLGYVHKPSLSTFGLWRWLGSSNTTSDVTPSSAVVGFNPKGDWVIAWGETSVLLIVSEQGNATRGVVLRSDDAGNTWTKVLDDATNFKTGGALDTRRAARDRAAGTLWVTGTHQDGNHVFHSDDNGVTWTAEVNNANSGSNLIYGIAVVR
jgi:hypothetical protein